MNNFLLVKIIYTLANSFNYLIASPPDASAMENDLLFIYLGCRRYVDVRGDFLVFEVCIIPIRLSFIDRKASEENE
jgi:hypothetical protein